MLVWFFFFKQKTAYEMRISDWSSDVCSSDLPDVGDLGLGEDGRGGLVVVEVPVLAGVQAHDVLGDLAPLHRRDRRQREATGEVTGDVDVRDVRLEVLVVVEEAPLVDVDAGQLAAEPFAFGHRADAEDGMAARGGAAVAATTLTPAVRRSAEALSPGT